MLLFLVMFTTVTVVLLKFIEINWSMVMDIMDTDIYEQIGSNKYYFKMLYLISGLKFRWRTRSRDITRWSNHLYFTYIMFKLTYPNKRIITIATTFIVYPYALIIIFWTSYRKIVRNQTVETIDAKRTRIGILSDYWLISEIVNREYNIDKAHAKTLWFRFPWIV